ncbi:MULTISPECIES: LolA family protein [unclassified Rathayibacter]|uniref:LolA family protein n=1 Tax=unclassified Rathayibacter TaxID=2609250 RepID=UPI00188D46A0|nr:MULTISPECIES: DUF2092 domain-containing protein [unclassified Rathayibacter]MBF4462573.1 DUF2092 domain-containing protein [Rathayibacter sp. VKM Ac-2879]MBF4503384.1 DUF2092 domain-containing protein [Rathayibacter sp. VKM Ac-2878]
MSMSWKHWAPALVVPAVVVAAAVVLPVSANAAGELPEKSASELLAFVAHNDVTAFSGEIEQSSDLGLPDLTSLGGGGGDSASLTGALTELATGSHEARVYVDEAQGARLQVLDRLAERDIVATPAGGVWMYDSSANAATHVLPHEGADHASSADASQLPTPSSAAEALLSAIDPTTTVTVGSTARVAGRDAYELVLTPRDAGTLVGSVSVAVDGQTGLPLGVSVTARGATAPAFSVAYSSIDFSAPDASLFAFTPPAGADVTEQAAPEHDTSGVPDSAASDSAAANPATAGPTVTGTGWTSVVELPAASDALGSLDAITTPTSGGRVLSSALVTVLLTDDGRVFAGAVPESTLLAVARQR